jgi:hypothetical protein
VAVADELGISFDEAAAAMHHDFLTSGRMRRFAAVLHHRKAGFGANAMGVWAGPQDDPEALKKLGETMAGFRAVSHAYQRPSYPGLALQPLHHGPPMKTCPKFTFGVGDRFAHGAHAQLNAFIEAAETRHRHHPGLEQIQPRAQHHRLRTAQTRQAADKRRRRSRLDRRIPAGRRPHQPFHRGPLRRALRFLHPRRGR